MSRSHTIAEEVRRAVQAAVSIDETAAELAELIRATSGCRWVGIYRVTSTEVTSLGWSGPAPPAHPVFPTSRGLTGAAIHGHATVCSNDVANDARYLTNQTTTGSELIVPIVLEARSSGPSTSKKASPAPSAPRTSNSSSKLRAN